MDLPAEITIDTGTAITLGVIFLLILVSGFFSGSETALTAASKARLTQLARKGSSRAATVVALRDKSDSLIGAILIGKVFGVNQRHIEKMPRRLINAQIPVAGDGHF